MNKEVWGQAPGCPPGMKECLAERQIERRGIQLEIARCVCLLSLGTLALTAVLILWIATRKRKTRGVEA